MELYRYYYPPFTHRRVFSELLIVYVTIESSENNCGYGLKIMNELLTFECENINKFITRLDTFTRSTRSVGFSQVHVLHTNDRYLTTKTFILRGFIISPLENYE